MTLTTQSLFESHHTITIESLSHKGMGVGYIGSRRVHVPNTYPKDQVSVKITGKKKGLFFGRVESIIHPSSDRQDATCAHFKDCGGCQWLDISYSTQKEYKMSLLSRLFSSFNFPKTTLKPIIGCDSPSFYRNKMEFSFGDHHGELTLGLKRRYQFDDVVPISGCQLQDPKTNDILTWTQHFFSSRKIPGFNPSKQSGVLKQLTIRHSKKDDEFMLILVTKEPLQEVAKDYFDAIPQIFPQIKSGFYACIHERESVQESDLIHLYGQAHIFESLDHCQFQISPCSFFQTNTQQAQVLYQQIAASATLKPSDSVLDLYCGTGSIGLYLSQWASDITGIEENPSSIRDAHVNAELNQCKTATFREGRVKNILKFESFSPDCVIVDPPRSGLVPKALRRTLDLKAPVLVYISCNPLTFKEDLKVCLDSGYEVEHIQPVDMFPHTHHVELVSRLVYRGLDK